MPERPLRHLKSTPSTETKAQENLRTVDHHMIKFGVNMLLFSSR